MKTQTTAAGEDRRPEGVTLRRTMALWFCLIAVLSCALVGGLTYYLRAEGLRELVFSHLENVRDDKISAIHSWFGDRHSDMQVWSEAPSVVAMCEQHQAGAEADVPQNRAYIERLRAAYNYDVVFVADPANGRPFVTTDPIRGRSHKLDDALREEVLEGRKTIISDVFIDKEDNRPEIAVVGPVFSETRELIGVLCFHMDITAEFYPRFLRGMQLGESGEVLLVNREGLAQSPLKSRQNAIGKFTIRAEPAKRAADGKSGRIAAEDYNSVAVMAAFGHIDDVQWGLVVKQDMAEVNAPVRQMAWQVAGVSLGVLVVAAVVGVIIAGMVARPAANIAAVAERIGAGELDGHAEQTGPAEMQRIAASLNLMVGKLAGQIRVNRALSEIHATASGHNRTAGLLGVTLPQVMEATRSQLGVAYLADQEDGKFQCALAHGIGRDRIAQQIGISPPDHFLSHVAATAKVTVSTEIPEDNELTIVTQAGESRPRSLLSIPLMRSGQAMGVLGLASLYDYRPEDIEVAETLSLTFGQSLATCLASEQTERLAEELRFNNEELTSLNEELQLQSEELRDQADELEVQRAALDEANRLKSQFLSNMSHELRTPLNSVMALSQLMLTRGPGKKPEQDAEYLQVIERNGRHLLNLINELLDLSKIESGRMEAIVTEFDPRRVVERALETARLLAKEKDLPLRVRVGDVPKMCSDEEKVYQILLNLLSNAVKFTEAGKIEVTVEAADEQVSFAVRDTGVGIAQGDLEHVFDEFRQVDGSTTRRHSGTGLGLSIGQKLARLLGGEITVQSTPHEGSTFTLTLPVQCPADVQTVRAAPVTNGTPTAESSARAKSTWSHSQRPLVLVVEDNEVAALQIRSILEESGYLVTVATGGGQALESVKHQVPDAIVLDLMMPQIDGFQVLEQIRSVEQTAPVPVLVLTAKELTAEDHARLTLNNVQELVQKGSVDRDQLLKHVDRLLGRPSAPAPAAAESTATEPSGRPATSAKPSTGGTVLVVEDNADNLLAIGAILDELDVEYVAAEDGRQAVRLAKQFRPGLVLMDIELPELSGLDAAKQIKADPALRDVPIVAVTAKAMKGDRETILAAGFDDYLSKPVDPADVTEVIRKWIS